MTFSGNQAREMIVAVALGSGCRTNRELFSLAGEEDNVCRRELSREIMITALCLAISAGEGGSGYHTTQDAFPARGRGR